jgi:hypothetical protein
MLGGSAIGGSLRWNDPDRSAPSTYVQGLALSKPSKARHWQQKRIFPTVKVRGGGAMINPLHVATVGGHSLRFFKTPLNDGRPDLPWHAIDDLQRCLGLNPDQRRAFQHLLRSRTKRWSVIPRTVATADGIVTVAPHFLAHGMIDALIQDGQAPARARDEYDHASADTMRKIGVPFPFPSDEFFAWIKAAMNRWEDA